MNVINKIEALISKGEINEARSLIRRIEKPQDMRYALLGCCAMYEKNYKQAEHDFEYALRQNPANAVVLANYGRLLLILRKLMRAKELLTKAYELLPQNEMVAMALSSLLAEQDNLPEALSIIAPHATRPNPKLNVALAYASMLRANMRPKEALEYLRSLSNAAALESDSFKKAIADCYAEIDPVLARQHFLLSSDSAGPAAKWNRSFVELRLRNFDEGWELYEHGLSEKIGKVGRPLPHQIRGLPRITELSELDPDKWTLFTTEQGIGDQVLFLNCLSEALSRVPKSCLVCEERLISTFKRSFPGLPIYSYSFVLSLQQQSQRINGVFPIGSLQKTFRNSIESFKRTRFPYIQASELKSSRYRETLKSRYGEETKFVGISWSGGFWDRQKRTKSIPFDAFLELAERVKGTRFLSLQYGDTKAEEDASRACGAPITFFKGVDFKKHIEDWIALIAVSDRVISVSTALVHFAGAMGRPVDLMLTERQSPFIWGTESGVSLPYPSVYIHRQADSESVTDYVRRVFPRDVL